MSKKSILIIVENLPVPFDRRVWQEATTLAQAGYTVSVICPKARGFTKGREDLEGVAIFRHPLPLEAKGASGFLLEYSAAVFWQFLLTLRVAMTRGVSVIHACNPPDLVFVVAAPFKLFGTKFIFDQHDLCPELYESSFEKRGFFYKLLRLCERATYGLADAVISTNQSYRRIAMGRGRKRADDVFVVRSAPDTARWPIPSGAVPASRGERRFCVGYLGVMGEKEGLDLLLETVREIVWTHGRQDIQFVLVGDGTNRMALEKMAVDLRIAEYVTFTGRVSDQDLVDILQSTDVCVNPDRPSALNDMSTMNKIIEYMALGRPIVQFESTEGRFSAEDASLYAASVDDFAAKILGLLANPAQRQHMGAYGKRRFEQTLAWEHQVPTLLAAYKRALGPKPARTALHESSRSPS